MNEELFERTRKNVFETNAQSCEIWNQIKDLDKKNQILATNAQTTRLTTLMQAVYVTALLLISLIL